MPCGKLLRLCGAVGCLWVMCGRIVFNCVGIDMRRLLGWHVRGLTWCIGVLELRRWNLLIGLRLDGLCDLLDGAIVSCRL